MQVIFIPPGHFSIFMVERGIIMPGILPASEVMPIRPIIGMPIIGMPIMGIPIMPPMFPIPMLIILSLLIVMFITSLHRWAGEEPAIFPLQTSAQRRKLSNVHTLAGPLPRGQGYLPLCLSDHARKGNYKSFIIKRLNIQYSYRIILGGNKQMQRRGYRGERL
jgi:hypothetical protein